MNQNKLKRDFYPGIYDVIFKGLLYYNKDIVCFIYNQLFPQETIKPEDIIYVNESIVDGFEFKTITADVRFNIINSEKQIYADIEMQKNYVKNYAFRNDLYTSKIMCEASESGSKYQIKNVVVISLCDFDALKNEKFITIIEPLDIEDPNGYCYYWHKNVYIQLPYISKCDKIQLGKFVEILKSNMPDTLIGDDPLMNKVIEEIKKLNQDANTRALINILEKKEQDDITLREMALEEGYAEGLAKGHAEGHAEGHAKGHEAGVNETTLRIAKSLKDSNTPIEIISSATGLSKEEIENL